jgi:hypothetical protein
MYCRQHKKLLYKGAVLADLNRCNSRIFKKYIDKDLKIP